MKFYLAPLEGVTTYNLREKIDKYFPFIDKYYIPFLEPYNNSLKNKQLKEIDPKNNQVHSQVVPQIISKDSQNTIWLINELEKLGYSEVNLNFGCPSRTVTTKNKGCGILNNLELLDSYLSKIFENTNIKISVKMRLGLHDTTHFNEILDILNKYPLHELIIHPRTGDDQYLGNLKLDLLDNLDKKTKFDIIYNGEIKSQSDISYIEKRYPFIKGIMLGRGLIERPFLLSNYTNLEIKEKIKSYYYELANEAVSNYGFGNAKFFLKQLWVYLIKSFDADIKLSKKLFKANTFEEFNDIVNQILMSDIKPEASGIKKFI